MTRCCLLMSGYIFALGQRLLYNEERNINVLVTSYPPVVLQHPGGLRFHSSSSRRMVGHQTRVARHAKLETTYARQQNTFLLAS